VSVLLAVLAVLGVIIAALYVLLPYQRLFTGPKPQDRDVPDLDVREKTVITPLIAAMAVLGIWSAPLVGALTPVSEDSVVALQAASAQATASHTVSTPAAADEGSTK